MVQKKSFNLILVIVTLTLCFMGVSTGAAGYGQVQDSSIALPNVLIIGDSISIGYTPHTRSLLQGKATVIRPTNANGSIINCGSSAMGLKGLDAWLGSTKWDVIHFNWGLWDLCYRHPKSKNQGRRDKDRGTITAAPDVYESNLRQLVQKLKATGATLVWATTTPVPEGEAGRIKRDAAKYNAIAEKIMKENAIVVDDLYSHILPVAQEYYIKPGDVHYTKEGYAFLASKVASAIEKAIHQKTTLLWPDGAPGALGDDPKDKPTITVYLPDREIATGAAVLICPGGGYGHLAMDHEGDQIAKWLNSFGVTGVVLNYRHRGKGYGYPAPLDDAQRAMRLVRSNAELWQIDTHKVGVLGFSAGGHLASTVTTLFDKEYGKAGDKIDKLSSRPDFSVLCYPVISTTEWFTHKGSKRNLLGSDPDEKLVKLMSTESQVTQNTPPTFLLHANDDKGVYPENSIAFYTALRKAKVKAELHIYEKGGHGFGLGKNRGPVESWPDVCRDWIINTIGSVPGINVHKNKNTSGRMFNKTAATPDPHIGWYKFKFGARKLTDNIIPVFKHDETYYSVCRGFEIPLKKCPEGLEWAMEPSSMVGTKIAVPQGGKGYIIIRDRMAESNTGETSESDFGYGDAKRLTGIEKPSSVMDPTAPQPKTNDDFVGTYIPVWFPYVRVEIRKEDEKFLLTYQEISETTWKTQGDPKELTPLANGLGFNGLDRKSSQPFTYNKTLKRFEITKTKTTPPIKMPLAKIKKPSSETNVSISDITPIGIPSWH